MKPNETAASASRIRRVPAHASCSSEIVAARMLAVVGDATLREVATDCGIHRETARRYLHGASPPSLVFVAVFADRYGISLEWLMCGRGPMYKSMLRQHHLAEASIRDVCLALGAGIERAVGDRTGAGEEVGVPATSRRLRWHPVDAAAAVEPKLSLGAGNRDAR